MRRNSRRSHHRDEPIQRAADRRDLESRSRKLVLGNTKLRPETNRFAPVLESSEGSCEAETGGLISLRARKMQRSGNCDRLSLISSVPPSKGDLHVNNRSGGGHAREDMFAESFVPEFVHGQTEANEGQTPYVEAKLN